MGKTVVIVQSNYIPWKGYFDLMNSADELILLDDVQYTRQDWRNRNLIKTPQGPHWLTIPVQINGLYQQRIDQTRVVGRKWARDHWKSLQQYYSRAKYFTELRPMLEDLYLGCDEDFLSRINYRFLKAVATLLQISTRLSWATDYTLTPGRTERLVSLCQQAGATDYVSGPSARNYIDEACFRAAGIRVRYADYSGYPAYPQFHPPFDHRVSVLDLLLHVGPDSRTYLLSGGNRKCPSADQPLWPAK